MSNIDIVDAFRAAMLEQGLTAPAEIIADGEIHRFNNGQKGKKNGWYLLHADGIANGQYGDWREGVTYSWCIRNTEEMSPEEREALKRQTAIAKVKRQQERAQIAAEAAKKCQELWAKAGPAKSDHPYLVRKRVKAYGLKQLRESLLIPARINGQITTLQFIAPDGQKRFKTGGKKAGAYYPIGRPDNHCLIICEGYATGATIHEATGLAVAIAFDSGNLKPVALSLRLKYPRFYFVIAADNDQHSDSNTGLLKAREAANAINATVVYPTFQQGACHG